MAKRVHQLAKELGVKSTAIVAKCQDEGLDVKNHMSTLSAGLAATIVEWFSAGEHATTVEKTARVDLEKVRVRKPRKRAAATPREHDETAEAAAGAGPIEPGDTTVAVVTAPEAEVEAEIEAEVVGEVVGEVAAGVEPKTKAKAKAKTKPVRVSPKERAETEVDVAGEVVGQAADGSVEEVEAPDEGKAPAVAEAPEQTEEPRAPGAVIREVEAVPVEPVEPVGSVEPYVPAPAQLQGPRVIRVERPDVISPRPPRAPRRRPSKPAGGEPGVPEVAAGPASTKDAGRKGRKRRHVSEGEGEGEGTARGRSRRRRGGRQSDVVVAAGPHDAGDRDLQERRERLEQASGSKLRGRERRLAHGEQAAGTAGAGHVTVDKAKIKEPFTVKDLSATIGVRTADIISSLMGMGVMASINQHLDGDAAATVALEYGVELTVEEKTLLLDELQRKVDADVSEDQVSPRPPVVAFLGHVDHGKTSLLDYIRKAKVVSGEAGGITQHIGSYLYDDGERRVAFLDTPGHAAFTAMRARGANMTDIVVLVVAADDGVMPQTVEAISHAKASGVPIVVALNKIDLPDVDENRILGQLSEKGLVPTAWGGETEIVRTSATTGEGIDDLVEHLDYVAELRNLQARTEGPATGWVIEAEMATGQGVLTRLLMRDGVLKSGDVVLSGGSYGKVRTLVDAAGRKLQSAGPAMPVEIAGLDEMPVAGDRFFVVDTIPEAKEIVDEQRTQRREKTLARRRQVTLENLFTEIAAGEVKEFNVIVKADVQGSVDVLTKSVMEMNTDEVAVRVLHAAVGGISESDVLLAEASNAIIIGFNVIADDYARTMAERENVEIRLYRVIYQISEDIRNALEGMLAPRVEEEHVGQAEVRNIFRISRIGVIAGCYVGDGVIPRASKVRLIRDSIVIRDNLSIETLRREKDDASEVRSGLECGMKLAGCDDIQVGDRIEAFKLVEVSRTLEPAGV